LIEKNPIPVERVEAEIRIGHDMIRFSAEIANEVIQIYDLLPLFQDITNKVVEIGVKEARTEGKQISCHRGCGACCSQLVPISTAEGFALLTMIDTLTDEQQKKIRERFSNNMSCLRASGLFEQLESAFAAYDREMIRALGVAYFNLNLPCPFLEYQSCSIHPVRPLSCREFLVVSDPVHCARPDPQTVESVVLPRRVSTLVYEMCAHSDPKGRGYLALTQLFDKADELRTSSAGEPATELVRRFFHRLSCLPNHKSL
jgi:Fe-S-cluster containining protein